VHVNFVDARMCIHAWDKARAETCTNAPRMRAHACASVSADPRGCAVRCGLQAPWLPPVGLPKGDADRSMGAPPPILPLLRSLVSYPRPIQLPSQPTDLGRPGAPNTQPPRARVSLSPTPRSRTRFVLCNELFLTCPCRRRVLATPAAAHFQPRH